MGKQKQQRLKQNKKMTIAFAKCLCYLKLKYLANICRKILLIIKSEPWTKKENYLIFWKKWKF